MVYATDDLRIDWNLNGAFTDANEDVTSRLLGRSGVTISFGRDQARAFSPTSPGTMDFELNNRSKDYSPENGSSPIGSNLKPGRPIRYQRTFSAVTYTPFRGFLDGFDVLPNREERSVKFSCTDALGRSPDISVSTPLHEGIQTGTAIGYVLDAIGWPTGDRDLDTGSTMIRHWWEDGTNWRDALQKILASEGSPAIAYVDYATNKFVFKDRQHRLLDAASISSQATFRDTGTEPLFSAPMVYDAGWRDIVNDIAFEVPERVPQGALSDVWTSDETISLGASASTTIHVQASDPFKGAVTPVAGTNADTDPGDYLILSGGVSSVTLSRTSGQSTIITITATASGCVIQGLKLRAYSVPVVRTYKITASDSASITDHGNRGLPSDLEPVWAGKHDAQALADLYILQRKQRVPILEIEIRGAANNTRMVQCLARAISDRITVVDAETGLNDVFFIERITHEISGAGRFHTTRLGLEKVPTQPAAGFIFGTSVFGTGVFGT